MDYPVVPIAITTTPTDWPTIYAAMFAAFFGAAAAFVLNLFLERLNERRKHLDAVNSAVYGLLMSISTLINLKAQSLTMFQTEFDRAQRILSEINTTSNPTSMNASIQNINIVFNSIIMQDNKMNGAFVPWQELDFPMAPQPNDFHFTFGGNPDLVRLIHVAKVEMEATSKIICERNSFWKANADAALSEANKGQLSIKGILFNYQMLSYRTIIKEHTNIALVVAKETIDQLEVYRSKHFKRRKWFSSWFFKIFARKEIWTTYKTSQRMKDSIPDKEAYKTILEVVENK